MKQFNSSDHVKNLPDSYRKVKGSNNYNILLNEKLSVDKLREDVDLTLKVLDIDFDLSSASDKERTLFSQTLNHFGSMLNQPRGIATDEQYRYMIKSKIVQSLSGGDFNSVINAICQTFNCAPSEISIIETDEPCSIRIENMPISTITKAGFSTGQAIQIMKRLIPAGIHVESFSFEGTFEFAADESDVSVDGLTKGFTDTEANLKTEFSGLPVEVAAVSSGSSAILGEGILGQMQLDNAESSGGAGGGYLGMLSGGEESTLPI